MFNIFKKIKKIIMTKQELEQQVAEAIAVSQRLGTENKELRLENETLKTTLAKASEEFNSAIERVRYLAGQVKMYEAQGQASTKYNDNSRNY
jgi:regulator of replication initiation timing